MNDNVVKLESNPNIKGKLLKGRRPVDGGGNHMSSNEFITQKDLDNLEEKIDLKMENIQAKMDAEFRSINSKIDNLPTIFENMLLKNEKEQEIKRKETNRYIWGTLILGTIGVIISVASLLL